MNRRGRDIVETVGSSTIRLAIQRGTAAWQQDDFASALQHFERILDQNPNFADIRNKAGLCLAMMGEPNRALAHFDKALELNESYAEAHLNRAIVLNELGRYDDAKEAFRRAGELDTRDGSSFPSDVGNRLAEAHARTGDLYMIADHLEEAMREYEQAIAIRPRFADIRTKMAEACLRSGQFEAAKEHLETILEERPAYTRARVKLGVVLHRLGDPDGARSAWEQARSESPDDDRIRAFLSSLEGDAQEAGA